MAEILKFAFERTENLVQNGARRDFETQMPPISYDPKKMGIDKKYLYSKYYPCTLKILKDIKKCKGLTFSQTTNFRPFQTERVCRRQFQI